MNPKLPEAFLQRMQNLLKDEFNDFLASFEKQSFCGLRVNTLKIDVESFLKIAPYTFTPVPWVKDGFYFDCSERPAKHPYYYAGLFYIQEPSAMAPVSVLDPQPGEKVLDLCAAPGGKSLQIAAKLRGSGLLVANDTSGERVKALIKNLEIWGVRNLLVTNETPERLFKHFPNFFDRILIDAPCSGEGMFRRDEAAAKSWSVYKPEICNMRQKGLLKTAAAMLKPGGYLVYSTCTFSPMENEESISAFLTANPQFTLICPPSYPGFTPGIVDGLENCRRLWPHKLNGEGHFLALLQKQPDNATDYAQETAPKTLEKVPSAQLKPFFNFCSTFLNESFNGNFHLRGEYLYLLNEHAPLLKGLNVKRPGWYLGELKKDRFEPSQAMAMSLKKEDAKLVLDLKSDDPAVISYLKGETLPAPGSDGWYLVCVDGFPLGWGKQAGGVLKNHYPKGWRWL